MKTTEKLGRRMEINKKLTKKERMYQKIQKHGEQLNKIFHTEYEPIALCKKLRRIELTTHAGAECYCNGEIDSYEWEALSDRALANLDKILNFRQANVPILINGDPRGYALKIRDDYMETYWHAHKEGFYKDWGGYGIIAPDFNEEV